MGHLHGCCHSGQLLLQDLTGTIAVVTTLPSAPTSHTSPSGLPVVNSNGGSGIFPRQPVANGLAVTDSNGDHDASLSELPGNGGPHTGLAVANGVPVANGSGCLDTSLSELAVANYGSRLLITDFWIIVERTIAQSGLALPPSAASSCLDSELQVYLHPVAFTAVSAPPTSPAPLAEANSSVSLLGSFIVSTAVGERKILYFQVQNKNVTMTDPVHGLKFTCIALIYHDALVLSDWKKPEAGSDEGEGESGEHPLEVAIFFRGDAFKWYSVVCGGCMYSLRLRPDSADMVLPSWEVLAKNRSLTVTSDMVVQYVGGRGTGGCVQDVAELVRQLHMPPLKSVHPSQPRTMCVLACGHVWCNVDDRYTS